MLHEKLHCYQKALALTQEVTFTVRCWPQGYRYFADQIKRASASIVLNIAEGNARRGVKDRKHFFHIARASAAEVSACLDLGRAFQLLAQAQVWELQDNLTQIGYMLYALK